MKNKWVISTAGLVLIVAGIVGYNSLRAENAAKSAAQTAKATTADIPPVKADNTVVADAKVVPVHSAALSFTSGGIVANVLVRDGDMVKAGQLLAHLDSARQAAAVAQAEAQLLRAQARLDELKAGARQQEVASATASLDGAKARLARVKTAGPPLEAAIAEAEVKSAQAQLDLVKAGSRPESIAAAKADVAAAKATLDQARVALKETELRAPFTGVVASLRLAKGEFVSPGTTVLKMADTTVWQIQTEDLTEINVVKVREGDTVSITFDAIPSLKLAGKVNRINPQGESKSGDITYVATIVPDKADARLRWNMTATVNIKPR